MIARWLVALFGLVLFVLASIVYFSRPPDSGAYWLSVVNAPAASERSIIRMRPDGSDAQRVPSNIEQNWSPVWSPDARSMVYVSGIFFDLYRASEYGRRVDMLSTCFAQEQAPAWSPDGEQLAFVSNCRINSLSLMVMQPNGTQRRRLTDDTGVENSPKWTPDGNWILFLSTQNGRTNIYRIRPDGSELQAVTNEGNVLRFAPSPTGEWIAYQRLGRHLNIEIVRVRLDGQDTQVVTDLQALNPPANHWYPWSPDGEWLLFSGNMTGDQEIYRVRASGRDLQRLTESPGYDDQAAWSPDGEWIAFVSVREGGVDVYRMRSDGTDEQRLTQDRAWDILPVWSPMVERRFAGFAVMGVGVVVMLLSVWDKWVLMVEWLVCC